VRKAKEILAEREGLDEKDMQYLKDITENGEAFLRLTEEEPRGEGIGNAAV
jgi:hypothetical protein